VEAGCLKQLVHEPILSKVIALVVYDTDRCVQPVPIRHARGWVSQLNSCSGWLLRT
jgi:hypothetical protein